MSIKLLADDDKPREKFLLKGRHSLSDSELLAIIMGSGSREDSAVELARKILASVHNNWNELSKLTIPDLMKFKGVGEAKAISISACLEIGRRKSATEILERSVISSSKDAFIILQPYLDSLHVEEFWIIFLNQSNKVISTDKLFTGGINQSVVDIRILFKMALEKLSTGIILAHNHPSGNLRPSSEDLTLTKKIIEAGKLLNIQVLDHIILHQNKYLSFADEGLL